MRTLFMIVTGLGETKSNAEKIRSIHFNTDNFRLSITSNPFNDNDLTGYPMNNDFLIQRRKASFNNTNQSNIKI